MGFETIFYPESRFGGYTDIDGTVAFFLRVNALTEASFAMLDIGCGRGAFDEDPVAIRRALRIFKGKAAKVIGIDVDQDAAANPHLDEFHLVGDGPWPLPDDSVDICLCDSVLEHLETPSLLFSEARRVLRDGGYLCLRTPNVWGYVALISRMVPNRLHAKVLERAQESRKEEDVFPTYYRCNTIPKIRSMMKGHGFDSVVYGFTAEPRYLAFSRIAYGLGVLYQRLAPGFLAPVLFAYGRVHKT